MSLRRQVATVLMTVLLLGAKAYGQQLVSEGIECTPMDVTANKFPRNDLNGRRCALVKVLCTLDGIHFSDNVIGEPVHKDGEYWVYISDGTKQLVVSHPRLLPFAADFVPLKGGVTYRLTLQLPESLYGLLFNPTTQPSQPNQSNNRNNRNNQHRSLCRNNLRLLSSPR